VVASLEHLAEKLMVSDPVGHEAVCGRPPRAAAGRHRRRPQPSRGRPPLRRRSRHHRALAPSPARARQRGAIAAPWPTAPHRAGTGAGVAGAGTGPARCHAARALRPVGRRAGGAAQRSHHVAGLAATGLAAHKKALHASERNDAARAAWWAEVATLDPARLIFVDESGTHTAMTRLRARAPRGERAIGRVPRNHGPNVTLFAALTAQGMGPAMLVEGVPITRPARPMAGRCWSRACVPARW
jgi:hypothetical protein